MILPIVAACRASAASRIAAVCWKTFGSWVLILQPPVRRPRDISTDQISNRYQSIATYNGEFRDVVLLIIIVVLLRLRHAKTLVAESLAGVK